MSRNIDEIEFTIFDTETTGLEPESGDRIVEIAGLRFKGKEKIATFQSLVNPHREISSGAFSVNQITQEMLKDAPDIEAVIPKFLDFIQGSCLCSYNALFDLEFLNHELGLIGRNVLKGVMVIDLLKMARRLLPHLERYALSFVSERLGIKTHQKHRALSDAELTFRLFHKLKESLEVKGISDFGNFSQLFSINPDFLHDLINQKIAKIQEAIDLGVKVKIKYLGGSRPEITERQVIPKEIIQDKDRSYLVGYCCLRNEERTFRVDGILHLEII